MKKPLLFFLFCLLSAGLHAQYNGTASVTQGEGDTIAANIYVCAGGRVTNIGTITASDSTVWPLPAAINYLNTSFPSSSDLYNSCNGHAYADAASALSVLNGSDIVEIDSGGDLFTMYIFSDNYFELYINGVPAGKDNVPYTPFNSSIVRFRAFRPFTIAMLLVDWEEHLGVGCETNNTFSYYIGDGGMVAVIKDQFGSTVATTGPSWRAQTFYTAPVKNLGCVYEVSGERRSDTCSTTSSNSGASYYGLHWPRPAGWESQGFSDANFPPAYTYSNTTVGVNNKPAYTNFTSIFDDPSDDAQFIWSSNLILDNEVLVRYTVPSSGTGIRQTGEDPLFEVFPNPAGILTNVRLRRHKSLVDSYELRVTDVRGRTIWSCSSCTDTLPSSAWPAGIYTVSLSTEGGTYDRKLVIQ
jgi:hypothetical protein